MIAFIVVATVIFLFAFMIWKSSSTLNTTIKFVLLSMALWGLYIIFAGHLLGVVHRPVVQTHQTGILSPLKK